MHTTELSSRDREMLLQTFRQYRAHDDEHDEDDYSNRDQLEQKLQNDGELDDLDLHMLRVSIWNEITDKDTINVLLGILPRGI